MHAAPDSVDAVGIVDRRDLPEAVRDRLVRFEALMRQRWRLKVRPEGYRMDYPELELSYFPAGYGRRGVALLPIIVALAAAPILILLPYAAGLGMLLWGVASFRGSGVSTTWWSVALGLLLVGAVLLLVTQHANQYLGPLNRHGLCLMPEGLLRLRDRGVQFVPRERIASFQLTGDRLYAALREPAANWSVVAGGGARHRLETMTTWLAGKPEFLPSSPPRVAPFKRVLVALAVPIPLAGFIWLTMVYPTRSAQGQTTMRFFAALRERRIDDAYGLLAADARERLPRDRFEARLPRGFLDQTSVTVNAVSSSVGTAIGAEACVDGWANLPDGDDVRFAFELVSTSDGWRISDFDRERSCSRH